LKECASQPHPRTTEHYTPRFEWPLGEWSLAARLGLVRGVLERVLLPQSGPMGFPLGPYSVTNPSTAGRIIDEHLVLASIGIEC
jgi:hypothetical protein